MNYSSNLSKYLGTIIKQNNKYIFKVIKDKKILHKKEFSFLNILQETAYQNAVDYKKKWSIDNNYTKNYYYIDGDNIRVHLTFDKYFITNKNNLDKIEKYIWYLIDGYVGTMISEDKKRKKIYLHNFLTDEKQVVHKDTNKMNNTTENLLVTDEETARKIKSFNHIKRKDNTSGFTGVYKGCFKNKEYWEVKGHDFNGNNIYKKYSIDKYGSQSAYSLACDFRDKFINQSYDISDK